MKIEHYSESASDQSVWKLYIDHVDLFDITLTPQEKDLLQAGPFGAPVSLTLRALAVIARRIEDYSPSEIKEEEVRP